MKIPENAHMLNLETALMHCWFDGFTSGASTVAAMFLPDDAADAKADECVDAAMQSDELKAAVRVEVRERLQMLMADVMQRDAGKS